MLLFTLVNSCKVTQINGETLIGTYNAIAKDYNYKLVLNQDNTFNLKFKALEANSGCEGKWRLDGTKLLILTCNEPKNVAETLQGGYMSNRTLELQIIDEKQIKYNQIILTKE